MTKKVHTPGHSASSPITLREMQSAFASSLLKPEHAAEVPPQIILQQKGEAAQLRMSVYRNNVFSGLLDAVSDVYPTIEKLLGEQAFRAIARQYFAENPPSDAAMIALAPDFSDHLASLNTLNDYPYLIDMARMDLCYHHAYHAVDSVGITAEALAQKDPNMLAEQRVKLVPSCYWLSSAYAIFDIWQLNHSDTPPESVDMHHAQHVAFIRDEGRVEVYKIDSALAHFLTQLKNRETLGEAITSSLNQDADASATGLIQFLLKTQIIASFEKAREPHQANDSTHET